METRTHGGLGTTEDLADARRGKLLELTEGQDGALDRRQLIECQLELTKPLALEHRFRSVAPWCLRLRSVFGRALETPEPALVPAPMIERDASADTIGVG